MLKSVTAFLAVLFAGCFLVGSATTASAHYRHHGCCGGPIPPTYIYKTHKVFKNVTRYRDVWRTRYVTRIHRIVHVNRIQPIINIHVVKRIHHHTVASVRNVNVWRTQYLPAKKHWTYSVKNIYGCRC